MPLAVVGALHLQEAAVLVARVRLVIRAELGAASLVVSLGVEVGAALEGLTVLALLEVGRPRRVSLVLVEAAGLGRLEAPVAIRLELLVAMEVMVMRALAEAVEVPLIPMEALRPRRVVEAVEALVLARVPEETVELARPGRTGTRRMALVGVEEEGVQAMLLLEALEQMEHSTVEGEARVALVILRVAREARARMESLF